MSLKADIGRRHRLSRKVAAALRARCGVEPGDMIIVATSGGADSVALLRALAAIAPARRRRLRLVVGHVQHHLRDDAEDDAAFVARLAASLGMRFERRDVDVPRRGNLEGNARRARYAALADIARTCGARLIATAHHADDQLETLLMRLMRGASVRGLRGIAWRKRAHDDDNAAAADTGACHIIRPMLAVDRSTVLDYLAALGQPYCEDHTNADVSRVRARLRCDVLPVLRDLSPAVALRATELGDHMRELSRWLDEAVGEARRTLIERDADGMTTLDRRQLKRLPRVVLTGLLRDLLTEAGVAADSLGRRKMHKITRAVCDQSGERRTFEFQCRLPLELIVGRDVVSLQLET